MPKEKDLNKTVFGLLFHSYFLYGLLLLIVFAACAYGSYYLFRSDEPLVLRIAGSAVILFSASYGLVYGIKNIRISFKDWKDCRKE